MQETKEILSSTYICVAFFSLSMYIFVRAHARTRVRVCVRYRLYGYVMAYNTLLHSIP